MGGGGRGEGVVGVVGEGGTFSLSHHEMVRPPQPIGRGPVITSRHSQIQALLRDGYWDRIHC